MPSMVLSISKSMESYFPIVSAKRTIIFGRPLRGLATAVDDQLA